MELKYNPLTKSNSITSQYCKVLKDNNDLCNVCNQIEATGHTWDRYVLPCNHISHTRCYRNFLDTLDGLHCPKCGPLREYKKIVIVQFVK